MSDMNLEKLDAEIEKLFKGKERVTLIKVGTELYSALDRKLNPPVVAALIGPYDKSPVVRKRDVEKYKGIQVTYLSDMPSDYLKIETEALNSLDFRRIVISINGGKNFQLDQKLFSRNIDIGVSLSEYTLPKSLGEEPVKIEGRLRTFFSFNQPEDPEALALREYSGYCVDYIIYGPDRMAFEGQGVLSEVNRHLIFRVDSTNFDVHYH